MLRNTASTNDISRLLCDAISVILFCFKNGKDQDEEQPSNIMCNEHYEHFIERICALDDSVYCHEFVVKSDKTAFFLPLWNDEIGPCIPKIGSNSECFYYIRHSERGSLFRTPMQKAQV